MYPDKTQPNWWKIKIPCDRYPEIKLAYLGGQTMKQVASQYGVNHRTIAEILKKLGVKPRAHQLYQYRDDFFRSIDTPAKAYFLGLMFTDGTIDRNERVAKITLQDRDAYILDRFAAEVFVGKRPHLYPDFGDYERYRGKRRKKYALKMSCGPLTRDLMALGCIPNKSLVLRFPMLLLKIESLLWHFVRGLIDGDGCIYRTRRGDTLASYVGSHRMVRALRLILSRRGVLGTIALKGNVSVLRLGRKASASMFGRLYDNSVGLRLERKYLKSQEAA